MYRALGDGKSGFTSVTPLFQNFPDSVAVDLNHDGCPDVVSGNSGLSRPGFSVYLCQSDGSYSTPKEFGLYTAFPFDAYAPLEVTYYADPTSGYQQGAPLVGDFDGDGNVDVAMLEYGHSGNTFLAYATGNGDGTFTSHLLEIPLNENLAPQYAGDVNGDGLSDLLQLDTSTSALTPILSTNGHASFGLQFRALPAFGATGHLRLMLDQPASQPESFTLTSSNPSIQIPGQATIPQGATSVDIDFAIPGNFDHQQTFLITASSGSESHRALGYAIPGDYAVLDLNAAFVDYGNVDVGIQAPPQTVTVTNFGSASLTNLSFPSQTLISNNCGTTLAASSSCQVQSVVTPTSASTIGPIGPGYFRAQGDTASEAIPGFIYAVPIITTASLSPGSLNFQAALGTTSPPQTATLTNTGNQPLVFTNLIETASQGFTQTNDTCDQPLAPGATCAVTFTYSGAQQPGFGQSEETIAFGSDVATPPVLNLSGVTISGLATASPLSLNFGAVTLSANSGPQSVIISNPSLTPLYIVTITSPAEFNESDNCDNATLAPTQTCTITATFSPTELGAANGSFALTTSSANGALAIPVSGTGVSALSLQLAPGSSSTISLTSGQKATASLLLTEPSSSKVTLQCVAPGLTCSVSPTAAQGPFTAAKTVTVTIAPNPSTASAEGRGRPLGWLALILPIFGVATARSKHLPLTARLIVFSLVSLIISACGRKGSTMTGPTNFVYQATVNASDGTSIASQVFTVTLQN